MKSYLQRLALGVMQPVQSIHPMVGSVFSPPPDAAARTEPPREEIFLSRRSESDFASPQEKATDVSPFGPPREASSLEVASFSDPRPVYRPLIPEGAALPIVNRTQPAPQQAENVLSVSGTTVSSSSIANDAATESSRPADSQPDEKSQEVTVRHVYAPIVSESLARSSNPELSRQNANSFAVDARQEMQGGPRHNVPASREPDEIQIHIGRIEVTAVQQASAPPATKPLRKGLNLEEYLRRSARRV